MASARTSLLRPSPALPPARISPARGRTDLVLLAVAGAAFLAGLLLFLLPLRGVNLGALNGLGLISVLPVASLGGLALLVASFVAMLARQGPSAPVLVLMLVGVIFCLDGVTALIEPLPRFPTTYQISGFVNYISQTGHVEPGLAAYFSWPGFFALIAFVTGAAGVHSLLPLMTWWPVVIDVLLLVPFLLLTRALRLSWRARWLAALLFCLGNWVGQDYFSPQSFNYLLYLVLIATLLIWFSGGRLKAGRRTPGELPSSPVSKPQRGILLLLLILIFVVSTLSHQLTPLLMIVACGGLVLAKRCTARGLPVLFGVILVGWISYGTVAYWTGHEAAIFGNVGQLFGTFQSSVNDRVTGTPVHQLADKSRIVLAGLMAGMALLGFARRRRGGMSDRALIVLFVAPLTLAGLQNYGGEIALRVYMFALPATAVLAACLFFPGTGSRRARVSQFGRPRLDVNGLGVGEIVLREETVSVTRSDNRRSDSPGPDSPRSDNRVSDSPSSRGASLAEARGAVSQFSSRPAAVVALMMAGVVAVGVSVLFVVARYGNEAFERTPVSEYSAMNYIYDHDQHGTAVMWVSQPSGVNATPQMPWEFKDVGRVQFVSAQAPADPASIGKVAATLRSLGRGAFLITTHTEAAFTEQTAGYRPGWDASFRAALSADPGLRLVYSGRDAAVYLARLPASAPRATAGSVATVPARSTWWSPVGIAAFVVALLLLGSREFIRECVPSRRWLLSPLGIASIPVLALLLGAVAARFTMLG
jgi:hypothetical protein